MDEDGDSERVKKEDSITFFFLNTHSVMYP